MFSSLSRQLGGCMLLLVLSTGVGAQLASVSTQPAISLDQAISRTLEHNPGLIAFGYQIKAQQGRVLQSGLRPNPELRVMLENALGTGDFSGLSSAETTISLAWVLERERLNRRVDAAHAGVSRLQAFAEIGRLDAASETTRAFLHSLAQQQRVLLAESAVTLSRQIMEVVQRRVQAGKTPKADLARAEANLAQAQLKKADVAYVLQTAYRRLAAQWGQTELDFASVSGNLARLPAAESYADLRTRIDQNPDLGRYLSEQRLQQAELRLAESMGKPNWQISAGLRRLEQTDDFALVAGFTVPLTLRNQNQGAIAEARANLEGIDSNQQATRVRIETQLFAVYQVLRYNLRRAKTLRETIIPLTEQALTDTRRAYELGRYGYLEWRAVQEELLDARAALVEASVAAHNSVIEIERLTGVSFSAPAAR